MRKACTTRKTTHIVLFFVFIIPLLFMGCSPKVTELSAQPGEIELNKLGETFQIKALALDKGNKLVSDALLQWASSDPAVVKVSQKGKVTAKNSGNAVITVTSPDTHAKAVISCKVSILAAINVTPKKLKLRVGEKYEMEAVALDERNEPFENQMIGWNSSDDKIVFIDDLGNITALSPGKATITAITPLKNLSDIQGKATITVTQ